MIFVMYTEHMYRSIPRTDVLYSIASILQQLFFSRSNRWFDSYRDLFSTCMRVYQSSHEGHIDDLSATVERDNTVMYSNMRLPVPLQC
jgi:hypothetical protein